MSNENAELALLHDLAEVLVSAVEDLLIATENAKESVILDKEIEMCFLRAEECAKSAKAAFDALDAHELFPQGLSSVMREKIGEAVQRWYVVMQDFSSLAKSQMDKAENIIYSFENPKSALEKDSGIILNDSI